MSTISIESIRARILASAPTHDYRMCLDPELRTKITEAAAQVDALKQQAKQADDEDAPKRRTIGGKSLADQITDAEQALAEVDAEAVNAGAIILLRWRMLSGDEYQALNDVALDAHPEGGSRFFADLQGRLRETSFVGAFTPSGDDIGVTWGEVYRSLSMGDVETITLQLIGFNKSAAAVPFTRASSGRSAQS